EPGQIEALAVEEVGLLLVLLGRFGERGLAALQSRQRGPPAHEIRAGRGRRAVARRSTREGIIACDGLAKALDLAVDLLDPLAVRLVLADQIGALGLEL